MKKSLKGIILFIKKQQVITISSFLLELTYKNDNIWI